MSTPKFQPETAFLELGEGFADPVRPARFPEHKLRFRNQDWANRLGLGDLTDQEWEKYFARFEPIPGSLPQPLALRYHGHQFRSYNPDLGDGRGFLYAQMRDPVDGRLLDFGTKGSGQTPYSRGGDGRLTLKGAVREALATEMLESLGVYTSKTFSVFETGEQLQRNDEPSPTRSAVLVRLNHSHIRYGTFQRLAVFKEADRMRKLIDYCGRHFLPEVLDAAEPDRPAAFLKAVSTRAGGLCADWMVAGFVHGVLNTDNMNITGESFDYGPYRFLPTYDPEFTAAYFDHTGLYAYGRQPETVLWNLQQLAASLVLIADKDPLGEALAAYSQSFNPAVVEKFVDRLGLIAQDEASDEALCLAGFQVLASLQVPFEQFFFDWYGGTFSRARAGRSPEAHRYQGEAFDAFFHELEARQATAAAEARLKDDYFAAERPCTLLIDEIEAIWARIADQDDWSLFEGKVDEIRRMGKVHGRRYV
jgi:uncharacterized protein YdiU (UPF0061 family)